MAARFNVLSLVGALSVVTAIGACTTQPATALLCDSEIVSGTAAAIYSEAVLVDMFKNGQVVSACSGAVIAPNVVLTAGHCVDGFDGWRVKAPYAKNQTAMASAAETFDYKDENGELVNPLHHDIGLIYLATPITLTTYPILAKNPVANGSRAVNVGRIQDGQLSSVALFVSETIVLRDATNSGFPFDYISEEVIQPGDSGGPVEIPNTTPHQLVAVNSGTGGGTQVLARVDLLYPWIQERIALHGGSGVADAGADGGNDGGMDSGTDASTDGGQDAGAPDAGDAGDAGDATTANDAGQDSGPAEAGKPDAAPEAGKDSSASDASTEGGKKDAGSSSSDGTDPSSDKSPGTSSSGGAKKPPSTAGGSSSGEKPPATDPCGHRLTP